MFIARQPIFGKTMDVFGYELLFRSGSDSKGFDGVSSSNATASVIGGLFESGIDRIVDDKRAFIIKFDLMETPLESIVPIVKKALNQGKILLAEKVEDISVFEAAKALGFSLFQGYFFSKPQIVSGRNHKSTTKAQYASIISELKKEEPSYQALAEIIEKDVNLAYRVMRIISARAGDDLVYSIKRALTYMGLKEIERWISILMIQDLGENKPKELITLSLVRTKFSEAIALHCRLKKIKHEASMMGLFSTLDAILDQNMADALSDISLPNSIKDTLIKHEGVLMPIWHR